MNGNVAHRLRHACRLGVAGSLLACMGVTVVPVEAMPPEELNKKDVERFADLALDCLHREYPNKIAHVLNNDEEALPPRRLTPMFYGCFDWHSAVHGHWLLVRLCRMFPEAAFAAPARKALARSFTATNAEGELAYLRGAGRNSFERPYGLAWFLQLCAELSEWDDPQAREWLKALIPIEELVAERFLAWLPKLSHPIRTGEHSQTAFAFGLLLDWARTRDRTELAELVERRTLDYYGGDRGWNLAFEPGGQDFLSPGLAEADLLRRVLEPAAFAKWLDGFLPELVRDPKRVVLAPAVVTDKSDGKLAHLDGLNLARAWMLEGIVAGLPDDDPRRSALERSAAAHRRAGLEAVTGEHYEGGHWLGSFAVYLVTRRGVER